LSLRGFDNQLYYQLPPHDLAKYENFTGCGNTVRFDQPAVRALVLDSLRYWVTDMHVDGFRFDLAPVLGRDSSGYSRAAPFFAALRSDPVLSLVKLIAEPWDVGPGGYQLGNFPSGWSEWNDRYRDAVRAFWRGDHPLIGTFAERFAGSSDIFRQGGRKPTASVNFAAAHDGFTLYDTVAYNQRHNDANLEQNRDGHSHNLSWNCGVEGPTDDPAVLRLRARQVRNLLATVLLSQGVPMLLAGDEFGRTQGGNNNAYCQDNEVNWIDWSLLESEASLLQFVRKLIDLRRSRLWLRRDTFLKGAQRGATARDISWLHPEGREMNVADWNDPGLRAMAVLLTARTSAGTAAGQKDLLIAFNAGESVQAMTLPPSVPGTVWRVLFDTATNDNDYIAPPPVESGTRSILSRSVVLLESQDS
jgi:glycogen operon protein